MRPEPSRHDGSRLRFDKVLIANRGEIAVRVIRGARALGYQTVAVYSDADSDALHVRLADEAVAIGGAAASESYLRAEAILEAAALTGAGAIHPGYGFLSENAGFAEQCAAAGIVFIGPPSSAIAAMGDKARAKAAMEAAGVPTVPGYFKAAEGVVPTVDELLVEAERLGVPLLVKAVAGGGGRGMRLVTELAQLAGAIASAAREAESAFGDGALMLERFVADARHIEVQVLADAHGGVVHLGERDCTAQRRRQKVIEEAPSPSIDRALRDAMGAAAVAAARAIGYVGAGTVEFIVDRSGAYYFLEMNTRLQVEHPVTELVTGIDLVEQQLRIASGERLTFEQSDVTMTGHAIEARLYAEDPYAGFAPQTGRIEHFRPDQVAQRAGVRIDAGVVEGDIITPHYDAMVAKFIAFGATRAEAGRRLALALTDAPLVGPKTNQRFLVELLRSDDFVGATLSTSTLDQWTAAGAPIVTSPDVSDRDWVLSGAVLAEGQGAWFRSSGQVTFELPVIVNGSERTLAATRSGDGWWSFDGFELRAKVVGQGTTRRATLCESDGGVQRSLSVTVVGASSGGGQWLGYLGAVTYVAEPSAVPSAADTEDATVVVSSVAGKVVSVGVSVGDVVSAGDVVAVVEAMKMETPLTARAAGRVEELRAQAGDQVEAGAVVVTLAVAPQEDESDG